LLLIAGAEVLSVMPLIIIAGGPCVGKSTFAKILEEGLREHVRNNRY
jgi:tRNA uridine 5-carbamoylmethylation protein Kti12